MPLGIHCYIRIHNVCHKQISMAWLSNYIPQDTVGCNLLSHAIDICLLHTNSQICRWNLHLPHDQDIIVNSLTPKRCGSNSKSIIFKLIIQNRSLGIWCEITLRWMPQNLTNQKSTSVQVMAWCHQATNHYLNQCWPRSMSPYGITRPQGVNTQ